MEEATIVYDNVKDKELLEKISSEVPIFVSYINANKEKKEAYKIKSHWGAIKNPFVILVEDIERLPRVFYSDGKGDSAVQQLINYLNNDCKN